MTRLLLNTEDLTKVRLSTAWGPFTETLLSVRALRGRRPGGLVDGWADAVRPRLGPETALLYALSHHDQLLDLYTLVGPAPTMEEGLEALEGLPDDDLRTELSYVRPALDHSELWARAWMRDLSDGDRRARRELVTRLDDFYRQAVDPYWDGVRRYIDAEAAHQARIMAEGGVDRLLATLHPDIRWRPPWLDVGPSARTPLPGDHGYRPGVEDKLRVPGGRSLVLVPTVFAVEEPHVCWSMVDESQPYVLLYPALRDTGDARALWTASGRNDRALAMLLGRTRASALAAIADTCTTTELAQRLGVSPPTASHHVGVMRDAGLVASRRLGTTVLHYLTTRGAALLED